MKDAQIDLPHISQYDESQLNELRRSANDHYV